MTAPLLAFFLGTFLFPHTFDVTRGGTYMNIDLILDLSVSIAEALWITALLNGLMYTLKCVAL